MSIARHIAFIALIVLFTAGTAMAGVLDNAKNAGLVGEQADGYVGLVTADVPPDVVALVKEVNLKRKAKYREIANKNGVSLASIEALAGKKLIERAPAGQYVRLPDGKWVRK